MKNLFYYFILLLLFANCCSKAPADRATASPDNTTGSALDSTTSAVDIQETASENGNDFPVTASPEVRDSAVSANLNGVKIIDSAKVNFDENSKTANGGRVEIISPNLTKIFPPTSKTNPSTNLPNSSQNPENPEDSKPKSAVLGFSYFPKIAQNETRDLRVFVKIRGDGSQVTNRLRAIEKEDYEFTKTDDSSIICIVKNIEAFKKLSIKPIYDPEDFKIIRVDDEVQGLYGSDPDEQTLDFIKGNYWHWKIKAIAKSAHTGNITLLIKAETPEGQKIKLAERQISIKIGIDEPKLSFGQKTYQFADAHFKEILSLIIIPLALYVFNLIRKKYVAKKEGDSNDQSI